MGYSKDNSYYSMEVIMYPEKIFYEPAILNYETGIYLRKKYSDKTWIEIESHNKIDMLRTNPNSEFAHMKQYIIIGIRKTQKFVPNHKVSDFLVPYTSSGCQAMCLYCYLVCNYNKCAYLRLFVNRESLLEKVIKTSEKSNVDLTFEIGSNSDLVLENTITRNLEWTIEEFSHTKKGNLTFPTKFHMIEPLLSLNHKGKVIFRMSVNPEEIINQIELGTSSLSNRIKAINQMCEADYPVGILIAPVVLINDWKILYKVLIEQLKEKLSEKVKKHAFIEIIFMTYSYVHRKINEEAFPNSMNLYHQSEMTGRGRGKYCYKPEMRQEAEIYLKELIKANLPHMKILYIV